MKPSSPVGCTYTPYYCEENVYLLAEAFSQDRSVGDTWETYVVFVSNPTTSVALWNQKLCMTSDYPVIWDYHCILLLKARGTETSESTGWVFDYDSRLAMPCPIQEYIGATFGGPSLQSRLDEKFQSLFRVVLAVDYLDHFTSDRSHMLVTHNDGTQIYCHPPPSYPCLVGRLAKEKNVSNNLMETFVSMSSSSHTSSIQTVSSVGKVMNFAEFHEWIEKNQ